MIFERAKSLVISFGPYRFKSVEEIAETDEGLKYLIQLLSVPYLSDELEDSLRVFLSHPSTIALIHKLLEKER